ncbi:C-X-C motif chemokine 11 [Astyanax mexicanus]|uniref:C-X-C motif chemokine 11-like n=1 Tax=Astyanax mexicanus TaxID=7994 RepID=A0A8T2KPY5_ASTMX|nr:C-X-C motif chemokine 11 [Astyanax mexicanus]KAG9261720.1 C-X-C motif chemokine 11-like [Astyanax mexicanus]
MSRPILLLLVLSLALAAICTAYKMDGRQRCLCKNLYEVKPWKIKAWEVHHPSPYCDVIEIVVSLKYRKKKVCLHPKSEAWKAIMQKESGPI